MAEMIYLHINQDMSGFFFLKRTGRRAASYIKKKELPDGRNYNLYTLYKVIRSFQMSVLG